MRPVLIACLVLSPVLVSASAVASPPKTDAPAATQVRRISTGITPPKIDSTNISIPSDAIGETVANDAQVVLSLSVDENGNAENVHVVKSANPDLDSRVVAAVSQSHFQPAKLDNKAIPIDVNLIFTVKRY
jgi:TonB family protein